MANPNRLSLRFARQFSGDGLRAFLVRGFIGNVALKFTHVLLTLAVAVLLARAMGPKGYGIYAFAFSLASLLAIPTQIGLPTLVVREVARYELELEWGRLSGLLRRANQTVVGLSAMLILSAALVTRVLVNDVASVKLETFGWALTLVPLIALGNLRGASLRGLRKVVQGQIPELLLRPALLLLFASATFAFSDLTPPGAMALHAVASAIAFIVGVVLLLRAIPPQVRKARPAYETTAWLKSILPLCFISGSQIITQQADVVMIGLLASSEDVGVYRAAAQGAYLISFGLVTINAVIGPQISRLFRAGDMERLQRMVTWSTRAILATSLPIAVILMFFGAPILRLVFGEEYVSGSNALAILCLGQLVNAAMGSVGFLLTMTGHEQDAAKGFMIAAISNIVLNLILIPYFGIEGAAAATAISLAAWNILLYRQVSRRIGIDSFAISMISRKQIK